ncbi:MAG: cyclic nucleotide-binding domain-containing protein [Gammaproteobacteria bacterium]
MMNKKTQVSVDRLKQLEPISALSAARLEELVSLSYLEKIGLGVSLFREGDVDNQTVYLLDGDVQMTRSDGRVDKLISSKSPEARFPLDDSQPRQVSATAMSLVEIVRIDNSVLDYMMMWDQMAMSEEPEEPAVAATSEDSNSAEPDEAAETAPTQDRAGNSTTVAPPAADTAKAGEDRSWIRKMRHIMAFKNMPSANIKRLLERMENVPVRQGEVIIEQGSEGDYYYVLTDGQARVTRTVELAVLQPGASFGEEALVSGGARNASITMTSDGVVMRLSKDHFNELLKEPLLNRVSPDEARVRVAKGARWLDVRHAKEFAYSHLPKALNIPLHEIRMRMEELNKDTHYICYCGTGRRSSAAAFLLIQQGYEVSVLNGGVQVMPQDLQR